MATIFNFVADAASASLKEKNNLFSAEVRNGVYNKKETAILFGADPSNAIFIKDNGSIAFTGGFTLETQIFLQEKPADMSSVFGVKAGSFAIGTNGEKLAVSWLCFPSEPIFTTDPVQNKAFPVGTELINGHRKIPVGKWVTLRIGYDEALGMITTSMNGILDRKRFRYRGPQPLQCDGKSVFQFFVGLKNFKLKSLTLLNGKPTMTSQIFEFAAWQNKNNTETRLQVRHIEPAKLPFELTVVLDGPDGVPQDLFTKTISVKDDLNIALPSPVDFPGLYCLKISAARTNTTQIFNQSQLLAIPKNPTKITIDNRTLMVEGRAFFPLLCYHVAPEDFKTVKELGFNCIHNDFQVINSGQPWETMLTKSLDTAQLNGLKLTVAANLHRGGMAKVARAKDHAALLLYYLEDEPSGNFERLLASHNSMRMMDPEHPTMLLLNNFNRLEEAAPACELLGVDPYPIPTISLRMVSDAVKAAVKATDGLKPVWAILPSFKGKTPNRDELKCMAWLAVVSGANGIGLFEWDHRSATVPNDWYTPQIAGLKEIIGEVFLELKSKEMLLLAATEDVATDNLAVNACKKGTQLILVNDSRQRETVMVTGFGSFTMLPLEVRLV